MKGFLTSPPQPTVNNVTRSSRRYALFLVGSRGRYLVVELSGRLGNHLWQFASGLGIARRLDAELVFDRSAVTDADLHLPAIIGSHYREATTEQLRHVDVIPVRRRAGALLRREARRAMRRRRGQTPARVFLPHNHGEFHPAAFNLDLPARITGLMQNEQYFDHVTVEVLDAIERTDGTSPLPENVIGVSFRRGDYNALGWALPLSYYDRAMARLADEVGDAMFVLFGDDDAFLELFAEHARHGGYRAVSGLVDDVRDPVSQFRRLAQCRHLIIPNSTFAWWAAWIGDHRDFTQRLVAAPASFEQWIRPGWTPIVERADGRLLD